MYRFIFLLALIYTARAATIEVKDTSTEEHEVVPLKHYDMDKQPDGSYGFSYEGDDKSFREETGVLNYCGTDDEAMEVSGSYRYIDANGQEDEVHYTAGKNGFVPEGTNIPVEITAQARIAADLPNEINECVLKRKVRDAEDNERRQQLVIDRQIQKIEDKKNEKIDIQVAKINKIFDRADSIIIDALSFGDN